MQLTVTQVRGIDLQTNSFATPDGSFQRASNVTFSRDNLLRKRRGFGLLTSYTSAPAANTLIPYGTFLLLAYNQGLGVVDTGTGIVTPVSGSLLVNNGARIRSTTANANLYMASGAGVQKLANTASSLTAAGLPSALDCTPTAQLSAGFLGSAQVGYRITFGRTDANNNTLESAPSEFFAIGNPALQVGASWALTSNVATITTTTAHGYTGSISVVLQNSSLTTTLPNSTYVATVASTTTFTFPLVGTNTSGQTVDITPVRAVTLDFSLPAGMVSTDTVNIYRTAQSTGPGVTADISTLQLVSQLSVTPGTSQTYMDIIPDDFRGAFLYCNPNQEGSTQYNTPPPFCADVALFKNYLFFANTSLNYTKEIDLINTQAANLVIGQSLFVHNASDVRTLTSVTLIGGSTYHCAVSSSAGLLAGQYVHFEGTTNAGNTGSFVIDLVGAGFVEVTNASGVAETCPTTARTYPTRRYLAASTENFSQAYGCDFQVTATVNSVFTPITNTARSLMRAVNRDFSGFLYSQYLSTPPTTTGVVTNPPGQLQFTSRSVATSFFVTASNSTTGACFNPAVPTSGLTCIGKNDAHSNRLFYSKESEPEHVPALNYYDVGPTTNVIQRIVPLRDSLVIISTYGVYRIVGNTTADFVLWALDLTVQCIAPDSVSALNNLVFMLTSQGVVTVSDTSVQVISRPIEPLLSAVYSKANIATETDAIAYEPDRLYILSTLLPNSTTKAQVYVYNTVTNNWSTWDTTFSHGVTGPDNKLYLVRATGDVEQERKNNDKTDYCDRSYATTVNTVAADKLSATVTPPAAIAPLPGDAILDGVVINRVLSVSGSVAPFTVTFAYSCNLVASDSVTLFRGIATEIYSNPLTGGDPSRLKHYTQLQTHFRTKSCSAAQVSFASNNTLETPAVQWATNSQLDLGFGYGNWGLSAWGDQEGTNLVYETEPNQILRVDIPVDAQRSTYIQTRIIHNRAAEAFEVQALATTTRPMGERTTR